MPSGGMTRDDHPNVSDQLYANYAIGQAKCVAPLSVAQWGDSRSEGSGCTCQDTRAMKAVVGEEAS